MMPLDMYLLDVTDSSFSQQTIRFFWLKLLFPDQISTCPPGSAGPLLGLCLLASPEKMSWPSAVSYCQGLPFAGSKLLEPVSFDQTKKIAEEGTVLFNNAAFHNYWIGVTEPSDPPEINDRYYQ